MSSPRDNLAAFNEARREIEDHPMCGRLDESPDRFTVVYPAGDFPVDGVRVVRSAVGLRQAVERMERHWRESFPGHVSP